MSGVGSFIHIGNPHAYSPRPPPPPAHSQQHHLGNGTTPPAGGDEMMGKFVTVCTITMVVVG